MDRVKVWLNDLVDAASTTREQVTITLNGTPAAVLIGVDEWESLQETLFWLSQPDASTPKSRFGRNSLSRPVTSELRGLHDGHLSKRMTLCRRNATLGIGDSFECVGYKRPKSAMSSSKF